MVICLELTIDSKPTHTLALAASLLLEENAACQHRKFASTFPRIRMSICRMIRHFSRTRNLDWSKRIRTFACRYQKPVPYHLAILQTVGSWGEGEGRSRARRKRAVQGRGDIASKQQGFPLA